MRRYRIGRSDTNDIVLAHASVSRQHAELVAGDDGRLRLTDLGSTYGTRVHSGGAWIAAADTAIEPDTPLRFGEVDTTAAALIAQAGRNDGVPVPPPAPKPPASKPKAEAPRPVPAAAEAPPPPEPPLRGRGAMRVRRRPGESRRNSVVLGIAGAAIFALTAGGALAVIFAFGSASPKPPVVPPSAAEAAQRRFLDACTGQWGAAERRCRCFLAAAGPNLQADDYDDFTAMIEAFVSGNTRRQETVLRQAVERRGTSASSRLTASFKGVVRDCPP